MPSPNLGLVTTDLLAQDVFDVLNDLIPDLAKIDRAFSGVAGPANLLVNPGFEINQRGLSSYTGDTIYSLDRWRIRYAGPVTGLVASPEATIFAPGSQGSAKCVFTLGAGTAATLEQTPEPWIPYRGLAVTLRMDVKCATPNAARLWITDSVSHSGGTFSAFHTGSNAWETLSVTHTPDVAAPTLRAAAHFDVSCTAYVDNATLVLGSLALPYAPLSAGEDLRRCQRYYEIQGGAAGYPLVHGFAGGAAEGWRNSFPWVVPKGGVPTVTLAGTWVLTNAASIALSAVNATGYSLFVVSSAAGIFGGEPNSADDLIVGEWNPS